MQLRELTFDRFEEEAARAGLALPIEQTSAWAELEDSIDGRSQWGCFRLVDDEDATVALVALTDYLTHGYHYLRAHHAPVWVAAPSPDQEREALEAIAGYVRRRDRRQVFVRLSVAAELPATSPVLSGVPYDTTVVIDVTGGDDAILARMKPRGRRDVRKSLREAPIGCADETDRARESFAEYYEVLCETAERDGFSPAPASDYEGMLRILGPARCRLFAGRETATGRVVTWSIVTISGTTAVRYYAASRSDTMRGHVTDRLLYFECCELGRRGCAAYDLMAVGSDFSPTLMGLNEFKTKFAKETTPVAPDRDLPLHPVLYGSLQSLQRARRERRAAAQAKAAREELQAHPREDLLPVILGGDVAAYAYAREFHEAYGVRSAVVNSGFVAMLESSSIVELVRTSSNSPEDLLAALGALAGADPGRSLPVVASTDALVDALDQVRDRLPDNVLLTIPGHDALARAGNKAAFAAACATLGLPTPRTEVVRVGPGESAPAPTAIGFPVVAKPARSGELSPLYERGFRKVCLARSQDELDELWGRLAEAGFAGEFLVQELVQGDDTHMGALTFYADRGGRLRVFGAAQTLLEDHAPTMRGNAVAMVGRVWPELQRDVESLVAELGYTGLGEVDVKLDPVTCTWQFLELNPRAGRNAYHMDAAGVNPMRAVVEDLVDGRGSGRTVVADEPALYTLVPVSLVRRYLQDPALLAEVDGLVRDGRVVDPQRYDADASPRRLAYVGLTEQNQRRKFRRYYPEPSVTSF